MSQAAPKQGKPIPLRLATDLEADLGAVVEGRRSAEHRNVSRAEVLREAIRIGLACLRRGLLPASPQPETK